MHLNPVAVLTLKFTIFATRVIGVGYAIRYIHNCLRYRNCTRYLIQIHRA
jgi:hypothetical protein